jgi:hypothetical protein
MPPLLPVDQRAGRGWGRGGGTNHVEFAIPGPTDIGIVKGEPYAVHTGCEKRTTVISDDNLVYKPSRTLVRDGEEVRKRPTDRSQFNFVMLPRSSTITDLDGLNSRNVVAQNRGRGIQIKRNEMRPSVGTPDPGCFGVIWIATG